MLQYFLFYFRGLELLRQSYYYFLHAFFPPGMCLRCVCTCVCMYVCVHPRKNNVLLNRLCAYYGVSTCMKSEARRGCLGFLYHSVSLKLLLGPVSPSDPLFSGPSPQCWGLRHNSLLEFLGFELRSSCLHSKFSH